MFKNNKKRIDDEKRLDERVIQLRRISRVVKGGRRIRFRATVVVGDGNGKVGVAVAKGTPVPIAITKAMAQAKKNMININIHESTIPHEIQKDYHGAKVFLKPARPGTGVIAGGAVRAVIEAAGIKDVLSKMIGSTNKVNNMYATFEALKELRKRESSSKEKKVEDKKKVDKNETK